MYEFDAETETWHAAKIPNTYIHSADTPTHTYTQKRGEKQKTLIHDMLLKANCFDFTFKS